MSWIRWERCRIVAGCAAYQAGNILGAVAGAQLLWEIPNLAWVVAIGLPAALLLAFAATETVAKILGGGVILMGLAFVVTAGGMLPSFAELARGALIPSIPAGSSPRDRGPPAGSPLLLLGRCLTPSRRRCRQSMQPYFTRLR